MTPNADLGTYMCDQCNAVGVFALAGFPVVPSVIYDGCPCGGVLKLVPSLLPPNDRLGT